MMQSCASAAKLRGGGPILHSGLVRSHGFSVGSPPPRIIIGRPSMVCQLFCYPLFVLSLMTPDVRRRPAASRPSSRDARGR